MTDQVLTILKFVLLGLLYLFFARVLWAVWSEVRTPSRRPVAGTVRQGGPGAHGGAPQSATAAMSRSAGAAAPAAGRSRKQAKGQRGRASRLVTLEPRHRRGLTIPLGGDVSIGRAADCTVTIDDDTFISQRHVRFYDFEGQPMVEDLGSTNGTFHNGSKLVGSKLLHPGDRVQVGTTVIEAQ